MLRRLELGALGPVFIFRAIPAACLWRAQQTGCRARVLMLFLGASLKPGLAIFGN